MYEPMRIEHIRDVLPHVEGRRDFVVAKKDGYIVIDYVYAGNDTFDHPARVECRGLKFDADGPVLARPFQKFFNVGERAGVMPHELDFSQPHVVMDKLDGSMIHPALVDGEVVFMTRMGRTDVARACESLHLTDRLKRAFALYCSGQCTPIFEWTAPQNRIVVPYPESRLTLLAARNNVSGTYLSRALLHDLAASLGAPLVGEHAPHASATDLVAAARAMRGAEGFVVAFAGGLMVKAKAEEYVLKHRAKESVLQEKNVLALVLRDDIDDVLPLLEDSDRVEVERYRSAVLAGVEQSARTLAEFVERHSDMDQKGFAVGPAAELPLLYRPLAFLVRAGKAPRTAIEQYLLKKVGSASDVDAARPLFGATFDLYAANDNSVATQDAA